ncbi:MAG: hypothetical protein J7J70_06195, partial [Deltaproteobacteria bacterium]|nr:hypothetical protein [Candidatus Tharpellaceae bacterium]
MSIHLAPEFSIDIPQDGEKTIGELLIEHKRELKSPIVAAKVDGIPKDLSTVPQPGINIELIDIDSPEGLDILRHSAAHVMAEA